MKHGQKVRVRIDAWDFDGDLSINFRMLAAMGSGSTVRVACMRAIDAMLDNPSLKRKRFSTFHATFVIQKEPKGGS